MDGELRKGIIQDQKRLFLRMVNMSEGQKNGSKFAGVITRKPESVRFTNVPGGNSHDAADSFIRPEPSVKVVFVVVFSLTMLVHTFRLMSLMQKSILGTRRVVVKHKLQIELFVLFQGIFCLVLGG